MLTRLRGQNVGLVPIHALLFLVALIDNRMSVSSAAYREILGIESALAIFALIPRAHL